MPSCFIFVLIATLCIVFANGQNQVVFTASPKTVTSTTFHGLGANWHALDTFMPGTSGGSAWGAIPPASDERLWQQLYQHANWLGFDFLRVGISQRIYEPEKDVFTFNGREMLLLYRILDWAEKNNVYVFLQQFWMNVNWNVLDPSNIIHSAPADVDLFAAGLVNLLSHLSNYTCIKYVSITNEPGQSFSWWQDQNGNPISITPALRAVKSRLDSLNLKPKLSAPDETDLPALKTPLDYDSLVDAYDLHSYFSQFDYASGGYPIKNAEITLTNWTTHAHSQNKSFFVTEFGSMIFGWGGSNPAPSSFNSSLKDSELVVRGINVGVDAFSRWNFINRGNLDGQWQLLSTWNPETNQLLNNFSPHPNGYFALGLLTRFTAKDSRIFKVEILGGSISRIQRIFATGFLSPKGQITLAVVNDAFEDWSGVFQWSDLPNLVLYGYRFDDTQKDNPAFRVDPLKSWDLRSLKSFEDVVKARSISIYSSYKLMHEEAGIIEG